MPWNRDRQTMRLFDEVIGFPSGDLMPGAPSGALCDKSHRETKDGAANLRPFASTPRLAGAQRADMSPAAFCKLTAAWAGAVLAVLLVVLAIRWLG